MTGWTSETGSNLKAKMQLPTVEASAVAVICLTSGLAVAEGEHETTMTLQIEEVGERLAEIERIEVPVRARGRPSTTGSCCPVDASFWPLSGWHTPHIAASVSG